MRRKHKKNIRIEKSELIQKALASRKESKHFDFKSSCALDESGTWCEIVKDIVAMANSGGGIIVVGLDNNGTPTGIDVSAILALDPAKIADQIYKYTGIHFTAVDIISKVKAGNKIALITVDAVAIPIVFTKPGTYKVDEHSQKTAFSAGTVYFRHGAKSEPGNTEDLRASIERQIEDIRKSWLKGVRKVIEAPPGSRVLTFPSTVEIRESASPDAKAIRIVDDPDAPAYRKLDSEITHPYRQKDVIDKVNEELSGKGAINQYDIQCVKQVYAIKKDESLYHWNKFANTPQYSARFVAWLVAELQKDHEFFRKTRANAFSKRH